MSRSADPPSYRTRSWRFWLPLVSTVALAAALFGGARRVSVALAQPKPTGSASSPVLPADLRQTELRVRVTSIEPSEPVVVQWRQGGEGLGGAAKRGKFQSKAGKDLLALGEWSQPLKLDALLPPDIIHDTYFTVFAGSRGKPTGRGAATREGYSQRAVFEVEHLNAGKLLRRLRVESPEGATISLAVPGSRRDGYIDQLSSVNEVARLRRDRLRRLPWAQAARPRLYSVVSDLGGFGRPWGYGVRYSDPGILATELESLYQLGATGLRTAPAFVVQAGAHGTGRWRARIVGPVGYPVPRVKKKRDKDHEAGCPFGPRVAERQTEIIDRALGYAKSANADNVWVLTVDEIGAVTDRADNGKQHLTTCERCRQGFVEYLKDKRVTLGELGARSWDEVRPLSIWKSPTKPWLGNRGLSRRAYYTREFLNFASASLFTPIRDELARLNAQKQSGLPKIFAYSLRGNNFISNGSSLDYFEFYRHADNAIVWETSNRDSRAWPWDSYLADVQRVVMRELGLKGGIYVKPHRGAAVQRMLAGLSRGDELLYWYTYGPDYWKGDSFAAEPKPLELASKAAALLGRAEPFVYGAAWSEAPRVAIVRPETTWAWAGMTGDNSAAIAALESGKWIYSALQHAHVPVDPLDERFLQELPLSRYRAIVVNGTHITAATARSLAAYVKAGGTLITSGAGLSRDEADAPLTALWPVLGVKKRQDAEIWCGVPLYGAGQVARLDACEHKDAMQGAGLVDLPLVVGREVLYPAADSDVQARFRDGKPALVRHRHGAGEVWLYGGFLGVEYAHPLMKPGFDMRRDFDPERRRWITGPLPTGLDPVICSDPLVEAVLLKSAAGRGHAITLANWAYADPTMRDGAHGLAKFATLVPLKGLRLVARGLSARRVWSAALSRDLAYRNTSAGVEVEVPELEEGDILTIE